MRKVFLVVGVSVFLVINGFSQTKPKVTKFPAGVPVKETGVEATGGKVEERTYSNKKFGFEITVPQNWFIGGADFERVLKDSGHDIGVDLATSKASRSIQVLMTAFRSEATSGGAILRVTSEDLKPNPQIRDAVDYFDAITAAYATAKLPPDFVYSATKAERLGARQFAYLDTSSTAGKKRMYATVKSGYAIMFTLSYTSDDDLQTLRRILEKGNFALK
ncbi:MAG TPA: hypothetical protein PLP21_05355 [Pyrinomonadaceae bacterium]|nr:hypothetical protein [Acidobacteriota bacterium]HQZ95722.1 hypothetical protein [Pyrinomonadaceae bacterium]